MSSAEASLILAGVELVKRYPVRTESGLRNHSLLTAVDGVSLEVHAHETLGIVGESGCGKTTLGRMLLLLETPTQGHVSFRGIDMAAASGDERALFRRSVQAVFQDPWSSLNPRMRIGTIIEEPLVAGSKMGRRQREARSRDLLGEVGLDAGDAHRFPHEFSGGQRQRIAIARALAPNPSLVILDEATSSLDVSIRAQILNLLMDLQERHATSFVFISHDLTAVRSVAVNVAVMYLGVVVERGSIEEVFGAPRHPYTSALLAAAGQADADQAEEVVLDPELPSPLEIPSGCRFRTRCTFAFEACESRVPPLREVSPGHWSACHLDGTPSEATGQVGRISTAGSGEI